LTKLKHPIETGELRDKFVNSHASTYTAMESRIPRIPVSLRNISAYVRQSSINT